MLGLDCVDIDFSDCRLTPAQAGAAPAVAAAVSIRSATSVGWETIATWLEGAPTVVAPIRAANRRSASGGIASSFWATRYQDGSHLHAGVPITSVNAEEASACWAA